MRRGRAKASGHAAGMVASPWVRHVQVPVATLRAPTPPVVEPGGLRVPLLELQMEREETRQKTVCFRSEVKSLIPN